MYTQVVRAACGRLRDNRFAAVLVTEIRDNKGRFRNLVGDTIAIFRDSGMTYYNELVLLTMIGSLPVRAIRPFQSSRKVGRAHQNLLVFCKGDPKQAAQDCGLVDIMTPDEQLKEEVESDE